MNSKPAKPTSIPLNPAALRVATVAAHDAVDWQMYDVTKFDLEDSVDVATIAAVSAYLAVAQPVVNSFDPRELNRKGWTCGCEPGNYDSCDECQSACNELANFLNRPEVPGA